MKRYLELDKHIEHFILTTKELELLDSKSSQMRLSFTVFLK
jgi:hypothetical protein